MAILPRLLLIVCCMLWQQSHGQGVIDSLEASLANTQADSLKVMTLIELSSQYYRTDPAEARKIGLTAKELAEKIGFVKGLAASHKSIGMGYYFENNWVDALVQWRLALEAYEAAGDVNGVSNMLNNLGAVHFNGGDDENALNYYLESLRAAEQIGDSLRIVTALINIGSVYLNKKESYDLAFTYYQRALPISIEIGDLDAIGTCAVNLGEIYLAGGVKLDSAQYYFETALDAYQKSATGNVAYALKNIGRVYARRGDYDEAIRYQKEAYALAKSLEGRIEMAQSLLNMAETYELKGDLPEALAAFKEAKEIATAIGANYEMSAAYSGLAKNQAKLGDFKEAYTNFTAFSSLRDTLYNAEMDKKLRAQTLSYEIESKEGQISLLEKDQELKELELQRQKVLRNATALGGLFLLVLIGGLYNRYKYMQKSSKIIAAEKEISEKLLLNILPEEVANELKEKGEAEATLIDQVTVLFTDFKGFTQMSEIVTPKELVKDLHECFSAFDEICGKYGIEKIKTIGDAYMAAGGLPTPSDDHAEKVVRAAIEMRNFIEEGKLRKTKAGLPFFEIRIGVHTGPVVAGIVGVRKFQYDIWGDTVNTASRMESSGIPGKINISGTTFNEVQDLFACTHRGKIPAKNKGEIDMYLVEEKV